MLAALRSLYKHQPSAPVKKPEESILFLFKSVYQNDQKSFNILFELFYEKLLKACIYYVRSKEAAEEIVSDVFVKLWQNRQHLDTVCKPEVYLFTAVKNSALNYLKKNAHNKVVYLQESQADIFFYRVDPEVEFQKKELYLKLEQAIESLPSQSRLIFKLVKEEGLKCKEVAQLLKISIRSVENQVFRAICKLDIALTPFADRKAVRKKNSLVIPAIIFVLTLFFLK